jgi:hypothetical protein
MLAGDGHGQSKEAASDAQEKLESIVSRRAINDQSASQQNSIAHDHLD